MRRKVIREWMALPRDKRQTKDQATAFAMNAAKANDVRGLGADPHGRILAWLSPRIGRA